MFFVLFVLECGTVVGEIVLNHYAHVRGIEFKPLLAPQGFMGVKLALQFDMFVFCGRVGEKATPDMFLVERFFPIGLQ